MSPLQRSRGNYFIPIFFKFEFWSEKSLWRFIFLSKLFMQITILISWFYKTQTNPLESSLDMESESKEKNQNKPLKNEDVNRILNYDSIEKPSLEKSPIRPSTNLSRVIIYLEAFKIFTTNHDENHLNEGFKTPISAKISACNSPMDARNLFSYASKRLDMSPFDTKNNESPFTCFAKNLRFSPMIQKPALLWPKYFPYNSFNSIVHPEELNPPLLGDSQ